MREYNCHICGGSCDPGELENGVCFDCRKEASERQENRNLDSGTDQRAARWADGYEDDVMEQVENATVVDCLCDEEYQQSSKERLKRERQAYEEAEREGFENGKHYSSNHARTGEDIL